MTGVTTAGECRSQDAAGPATPGPHAWEALRGWEVLFGLSLAVAVLFVVVGDGPSPATRGVSVALLVVDVVAYVLLGRPAIIEDEDGGRRALAYWAVVLVTFVPATVLSPSASFALFALCPQAFMTLGTRSAAAAVIVLNVAPAIQILTAPGAGPGHVLLFGASAAVVLTFTLVFGPWISRIIAQSAERAQLIAELEASRAEAARLHVERGALAERERLAGEIHDTLAQGLTSIIMLIQAAQAQPDPTRHLGLAVQTARENLAEARALIAALSPPPLDGSTLEEALRRVTARLAEELGVEAAFTTSGRSRPLPPNVEVVLVRAAQEGLANVRRHAGASSVTVSLAYGEADVQMGVRDDGGGFDAGAAHGYGLRAMRTRVEQEGGSLRVDSAPGDGTTLTVTLPAAP
ncbi:sensor histidine kinase [Microbispora sp. ATCC PTA-5024]|uniref:sensor histidine kinase n=1 Tax=Microbispora sp. ATCC PTA-5024 TaxID=316330 RepID=UPI0003DCCA24|nr:sensor histidine kinase [Microbispora sp. ATCC PTA-5024]ETK33851.1 hypothetical protein MPTA5024_22405 [Microbispora sp. ATCC PTA-5024]